MRTKKARMAKIWMLLTTLGFFVLGTGCFDTRPKTLGRNSIGFGSTDNDTSTGDSFKFKFVYRDATAASPLDRIFYFQGANNSKSSILSTCNAAGTSCVCEFLENSTELEESDHTDISYDSTGNYLRCEFDGTAADLARVNYVRIRNQSSTVTSATYELSTSLTARQIVGDDVDFNLTRTVYRYGCLYNFLQKQGTSETAFDCSTTGSLCDTGVGAGNFCLLQTTLYFRLFADNYFNNFNLKIADILYNAGADERICGIQIKRIDCGGTNGTLVKEFGLYGSQVGSFTVPVNISAGPDLANSIYGYAAQTSTFQGNTVCPPGMQRHVFYQAVATNTGLIGPSHNYPTNFTGYQVGAPGSTFSRLEINKVGGGNCTGTACSLPTISRGLVTDYGYTSTGSEFCVIPGSLL